MNAVVSMTGQGGWPMSVFLTPEGEPFFGGTYYPPEPRYGMPSFRQVLEAVIQSWESDHDKIRQSGKSFAQQLSQPLQLNLNSSAEVRPLTLEQATRTLLNNYDWKQGGWGQAPRFPQPMSIDFLLMQATRGEASLKQESQDAAVHALKAMSRGGMYDVVGGGFHRYSTDNHWLVPHFEKMLYDNAQLSLAYLHAFLRTGDLALKQVCTDTLDFILREMRDPAGGFYSSLDADSEGEEGKYYLWTEDEIVRALPDLESQNLFLRIYPVRKEGNFEGKTILQREKEIADLAQEIGMVESDLISSLEKIHRQLYEFREQRVRPATDDKVLVSWNALALRAFAQAARYLKRPDYLEAAQNNAHFLLNEMVVGERLMRAWRKGQAGHNAYLEDYAALALALVDLYQSQHRLLLVFERGEAG